MNPVAFLQKTLGVRLQGWTGGKQTTWVPALVDASGLCSGQEVVEPGCLGGKQREGGELRRT